MNTVNCARDLPYIMSNQSFNRRCFRTFHVIHRTLEVTTSLHSYHDVEDQADHRDSARTPTLTKPLKLHITETGIARPTGPSRGSSSTTSSWFEEKRSTTDKRKKWIPYFRCGRFQSPSYKMHCNRCD
ncbi:hypothetical protein AVEN_69253-1 [Araneus ventricosus]|uniref:Uncharacterized protein n=1 Tax=Araneus ventricosus TaxID=182803 RepID=A0A4Y2QCH7_ARAVE|nr:hypothetical protein AVEN_69253-1 [Araneus ventricosus]